MANYLNPGRLESRLETVTVHSRGPEVYETKDPRRQRNTEYVYVNSAFVSSSRNINLVQQRPRIFEPPTSVVREQYWACSKWPYGQRVLAIAVGVLLGTVIGLSLLLGLGSFGTDAVGGLFRSQSIPD